MNETESLKDATFFPLHFCFSNRHNFFYRSKIIVTFSIFDKLLLLILSTNTVGFVWWKKCLQPLGNDINNQSVVKKLRFQCVQNHFNKELNTACHLEVDTGLAAYSQPSEHFDRQAQSDQGQWRCSTMSVWHYAIAQLADNTGLINCSHTHNLE